MIRDFKPLYKIIGYQFNDVTFLQAALTHRSVQGLNNERFEFLGDAILNYLIADALYSHFIDAREGELTRLRATLVKGDTLAEMAKEFAIGTYLILGQGERKSGGHRRKSILADALEAIIAAIYLDGGMDKCKSCVERWFKDRITHVKERHHLKDPKTRLQEHLQSIKQPLPTYTIVTITGDTHDQKFHLECKVEGLDIATEGIGSNRRQAEQNAADEFYSILMNQK